MKEAMKKDLLNIMNKASSALSKGELAELDTLSDETISYASIYQDKESVQVAVISYALVKIAHNGETKPEYWNNIKDAILTKLKQAKQALSKNDEKRYYKVIKFILRDIGKADDQLRSYIEDVLEKAKIVKGSKMYDTGVSAGRASELLGVSQWELLSYIGKTKIVDEYKEDVVPAKNRLEYAKSLFGL